MFGTGIRFWFLGFAFALVCFGSVWGVTMHFCAWFFFAAVLLLCSVFFFLQDLTTAEDEERTPDLDLERLSGGAGWRVTWRLQPGEVGLFWRLFCAFFS